MDIRSILPKKGCKKIKRTLKYNEEVKELTFLQMENAENSLIKLKNDLIEKFKKNNKIKKVDRENKFHGLKDIRNLFNENNNHDIYEGTEYLFDEEIMHYYLKNNVLEYEEIKKLLSVKPKKELIKCVVTKGIIKQEYAVDYDVNYYRANYRRCERVQEIDYVKYKPNLINDALREVKIVETIDDNKVEFCKIIDDNRVEFCEIIEDRKAEHCQLIEGTIESYELIKEETIKSHEIIEEEIIESFELIEDKDYINKLIEDKNDVNQLMKKIIESYELIEDQEDINELIVHCELSKE